VRICVSGEVADAIRSTGEVNGPVITIPNAIEVPIAGSAPAEHRIPLLVAGWKDAGLTAAVADRLRSTGFDPEVIAAPLPREAFLSRLAAARVVVLLPLEAEGCFLPALEAFALGCLVVCPDCIGNRQFCRDRETCLRPPYALGSIVAAVETAMAMAPAERERIVAAAAVEAAARGLEGERRAFLDVLDHLPQIW
jgi:glycosyltransferase involved in cell wall biosynthesis